MLGTIELGSSILNKARIRVTVPEYGFFWRSTEFYKNLEQNMPGVLQGTILAACTGGAERSNSFNNEMRKAGFNVSQRTADDKNDPASVFSQSRNEAISVAGLMMAAADGKIKVTTEGLHIEGLTKPITNLVIFTDEQGLVQVRKLLQQFEALKPVRNKLPIALSIISETNLALTKAALTDFISPLKAA
jgi:hypothetical protein